jgi:hypothetical protein
MTRRNPTAKYIHYPLVTALICAAALDASAAQYWRGTTDNPVWDLTTANWASSASATTYSTYQNNTSSSQPYFDAGGATDIMVDEDGVLAYVINVKGGNHTLTGGPITAQVMDPLGGDLTIFNTVTLSPGNTANWAGFRARSGGSTITVGDGGYLDAEINPYSDSTLATKLVVATGGLLKANFQTDSIKNNKFTLYFNGGSLIHRDKADRTFTNSKFILGVGGLHFLDNDGISSGEQQFMPGPILTDSNLATDGGLWFDEHIGYALLPNSTACTYNGGVHINSAGGYVAARYNGNLGANPASPTNNIFFLKNGARFVAHGGNGRLAINPNRNLFIADGVKARLMTWSGSRFSMLVQGTINCENVTNGVVETVSYSGIDDAGVVALCPTDGRTNRIGRLLVKAPTLIGSGTTILENNTQLSVGTGANDERWAINDGAVLNISQKEYGHLMVTGGVLKVNGSRSICQSGKLTISGGMVDFSGHEFMHGYNYPAETTIRGNGTLIVSVVRMAGDNSNYYTDANNSIINLETGGVLRVTNKFYLTASNKKGIINFNGGILDWARPISGWREAPFPSPQENSDYKTWTANNLLFNVLEGGMIISNNYQVYFSLPVRAGAEHDGGIEKWGSALFSLSAAYNSFNGPIRIMQGGFSMGANDQMDAGKTACVNAGTTFNMNTYQQTFARIEGSGSFVGVNPTRTSPLLTVTSAIAPGMGADAPGTLTLDGGINIADNTALEIDVDENGNSDCFSYPEDLDLSKLRLVINDGTKLDRNHTYTILTVAQGMPMENQFASVSGLPETWHIRYTANSVELHYTSPFMLIVR